MFNIFKKIKQIIVVKKEDIKLAEAIVVAQKLGVENKQLKKINEDLTSINNKLNSDFNSAVERVRYLAEQLKIREAQQQAYERFNDNNRNY
jgi:3-hydroxyisobutyrate dehydrogenase-like beta-hydroxyacid dehydrogenase